MKSDAHVHILTNKQPTLYENYILDHEIGSIIGIYDNYSDVIQIKSPNCTIYKFFWMHEVSLQPDPIPDGLKFESWIDNIAINENILLPALIFASKYGLPLLIHCNQLRPDLSRPSFVADIAKQYKDLKFIIAHSGSYAPPLPEELAGLKIMEKLVFEAINACTCLDNVFIESSILASPRKRKLILDNIDKIEDRLLLGTDFPFTVNDLVESRFSLEHDYSPTISSEEAFLVHDGLDLKKLEKIHSNLRKIF
ncbi:MAG: amidohydrolase family protein [Candidatus Lokiarchaeota archaeon]|nr:amidohydrolase family protein [Candidatus Lokiarchaeota archaeon]